MIELCCSTYLYSPFDFRYRAYFEQGVHWLSGKYRVWIHSEIHTWHDKNIQSDLFILWILKSLTLDKVGHKKRKGKMSKCWQLDNKDPVLMMRLWGEKVGKINESLESCPKNFLSYMETLKLFFLHHKKFLYFFRL